MNFEEAVVLYLADFKERSAVSSYHHYRKRLTPYRIRFGAMQLVDIKNADVLAFVKEINRFTDGREKAPDTIRSNVQAWEQLQEWMFDDERKIIPAKITPKKIQKPGGRKREALPTSEETKAIIANGRPDFIPMYRALRLTGARPGELCKARIEDIDWISGEIVLHQHKTARKTGKPRRIALGHSALIQIVSDAIGDRRSVHIFLRANGRPWRTELVSTEFRKARDSAGLRKVLVLYLARHEHATSLYKQTGDLKTVADALGHTQLTTTMRYTRVDPDRLKSNQRLFEEGLDFPSRV